MKKEFVGKEIGGKKFGIPLEIFYKGDFNDTVKSLSGLPLYCVLNSHQVLIEEPFVESNPLRILCYFCANVSNANLSLQIFTKTYAGKPQYHPDLFAAQLLEETFSYFSRRETYIGKVSHCWQRLADTYKQFIQALDLEQNPEPTKEMLFAAARKVWTPQLTAKHGFTKLNTDTFIWSNIPGNEAVYCEFFKE